MTKQKLEIEVDVPEGSEVWNVATASNQSYADCRITFKPVVKYRDVTADDVGKEIEVLLDGEWQQTGEWQAKSGRLFIGFNSRGHCVYEIGTSHCALKPEHCRIIDDGAKPKREWSIDPKCRGHINVSEDVTHYPVHVREI